MDLTLVGHDGVRWNIHGRHAARQGVALLKGSKKLWEAPIKSVWMQGAFQEGATYLGYKTEPIDLVLAIGVRGKDREEWQATDSRFIASMGSPDDEVTLEARSSSGTRSLTLRLMASPELAGDYEEHRNGVSQYVMQFRAGWPRWVGEADTSVWTSAASTGSGFVTVTNPTDTWMYPQWVCSAPGRWVVPDFSWGDDDQASRLITTPTLSTGQDLTIDTYPANEPYVARDGSNIAGRFGGVMFLHPVPPHTPPTKLPVRLEAGKAGSAIMLRMPRNYRRPWGGDLT